MKEKANLSTVMIFAGTYIATIIGSGFATGQEIFQFFAAFGPMGFVGTIIALIAFIFCGVELLYRGKIMHLKDSIKMFQFYCGKPFGKFLEYFVPLYLFAVYIIMISGAGATLSEYYGLNPFVGRVLMSLLSLISVVMGLQKILNVLGNIGPVIIVFTLIIAFSAIFNNIGNWNVALETYKTLSIPKVAPNAIISGVLFPCYNAIVVVGFLASMGATAKNKKECVLGGIFGGIGLAITCLFMTLAMFLQIDKTYNLSIPTLFLAKQVSPLFANIFSVILMMGIYTSAVPLLWQVSNRIYKNDNPNFNKLVIALVIIGFLGGLLPFEVLVAKIYPFIGYVGVIILILMIVKVIILKVQHRDGSEEMKEYQEAK